jgi:hypothetical protein
MPTKIKAVPIEESSEQTNTEPIEQSLEQPNNEVVEETKRSNHQIHHQNKKKRLKRSQ